MSHLTEMYRPTLADAINATKPGQAHWARPDAPTTCRQCIHWKPVQITRRGETHDALPYDRNGALRTRLCGKYRQFAGRNGPRVPHNAAACRYLEPSDNPPAESITPTEENRTLWRRRNLKVVET
jgi:hypothetical protein